jgi:hypothetical protein
MAVKHRETAIEMEPNDSPTVYVSDVTQTRFGPKAVLGGDTYDAKGAIKELGWDETHRSWDNEIGAWTLDAGALDELARVLDANGMALGGLGGELAQALLDHIDGSEDWWGEYGLHIEVTYEKKRSGDVATKEGVVSSVNTDEAFVQFKRDDHVINRVRGDALLSPQSDYPYMGDVVRVEVWEGEPL